MTTLMKCQIFGRIRTAIMDYGPQTTSQLLAVAHRINPGMTKAHLVEFLQDLGEDEMLGERTNPDDQDLTWILIWD